MELQSIAVLVYADLAAAMSVQWKQLKINL